MSPTPRYAARSRLRAGTTAVGIAAALALTGCTSDSSTPQPSGSSTAAPVSSGPIGSAADLAVLDAVQVADTGAGKPPTVTLTKKPVSVTATTRKVLTPGTGPAADAASSVVAHFVLYNGTDSKQLDSTYEGGGTAQSLKLSDANMLKGLRVGLIGVQAGSRVLIVIPPSDAFGGQDRPDLGLTKTDNLVLVADVSAVTKPLAQAEGTPVEPKSGLPTVTFDPKTGPKITRPGGAAPPTQLVVQPLIEGTGAVVKAGQTVTVHYTGALWRDGSVFDSSWTRGTPFETAIGAGQVIKGWDTGIVGQKVGSRVLLIVPPDQGYGAAGSPPKISGTDTLIFVVDILAAG
mgnify:CR=1 FL=1